MKSCFLGLLVGGVVMVMVMVNVMVMVTLLLFLRSWPPSAVGRRCEPRQARQTICSRPPLVTSPCLSFEVLFPVAVTPSSPPPPPSKSPLESKPAFLPVLQKRAPTPPLVAPAAFDDLGS